MRLSVKIKNLIAKTMILISVLTLLAIGSNPDNFTLRTTLICGISALVGWAGYKLWQW